MLARDLSALHPGATFVVDVKSTGLFATDPVLQGATAPRPTTGRPATPTSSAASAELAALAGFEKSRPLLLQPADRPRLRRRPRRGDRRLRHARPQPGQVDGRPQPRAAEDLGLADHVAALRRRGEVRRRRARGRSDFTAMQAKRRADRRASRSRDLVTVNGVRVVAEDGTWGLVRASSNKPELVVVVESPVSEARHARDVRGGRRRAAREPGGRRLQPDDLTPVEPNQAEAGGRAGSPDFDLTLRLQHRPMRGLRGDRLAWSRR